MEKKSKRGERVATPYLLQQLFYHNTIADEGYERSQEIAGFIPNRDDWLRFIDLLILALGTIFLVAGILFFFAFNWADLPKFGKFAIVQGAVIVAIIAAFVLDIDKWGGRMALAAGSILVGVALGVVGTTYQTGADSYNLFIVWTMLVTGWALISRWNVMYLIWLILLNTSVSLYWTQVIDTDTELLNLLIIGINFGFIVVWDLFAYFKVFDFIEKGRWLLYLVMIPVAVYATYLMMDWIFDYGSSYVTVGRYAPFVYGGIIAAVGVMYMVLRQDLLMVTIMSISVLVISVSGVWRIVANNLFASTGSNEPFAIFCIMGFFTIGMTSALVVGLRYLQRRWEIDE